MQGQRFFFLCSIHSSPAFIFCNILCSVMLNGFHVNKVCYIKLWMEKITSSYNKAAVDKHVNTKSPTVLHKVVL